MPRIMETAGYKKLAVLARQLGGRIVYDPKWAERDREESFWPDIAYPEMGKRGYSDAPFCTGLGVYWAKKIIVHQDEGFTLSGLIHEMGHVFACRFQPSSKHVDETKFLGWEIVLSRRLGVHSLWLDEMGTYGVHTYEDGSLAEDDFGDFSEIKELSDKQRRRLFKSAIEYCQKLGTVGPRRGLRSVRN